MFISLEKRVQYYIESKPGAKILAYDAVLQDMLKEGKLTKAEYENLVNISIFKTDFDWYQGDLLTLSNPKKYSDLNTSNDEPDKIIQVAVKRIPEILDRKNELQKFGIFPDEKGLYSREQLFIENLKKSFDNDKIEIKEEGSQTSFIDSKTGKMCFSVFDFSKAPFPNITININDVTIFFNVENDKWKISNIFSDGVGLKFDEQLNFSGDLQIYDTDAENLSVMAVKVDKDNNILEVSSIDKYQTNYLDIMIATKNINPEQFNNLILRIVNPTNVFSIILDYEERTGEDLLRIPELNEHLLNCMSENDFINQKAQIDIRNKCFAKKMYDAISSGDEEYIYDIERFINNSNIVDVMNYYAEYKYNKNDIRLPENAMLSLLYDVPDYLLYDLFGILSEANIPPDKTILENFLTENIDIIKKNKSSRGIYFNDIEQDYKNNLGNSTRQFIDLRRLLLREFHHENNENKDKYTQFNGEIDKDFSQGNIGDCWLLAGLISINSKENGRAYLESLLEPDIWGQSIVVNLPGVNKRYAVSINDVNKHKYLSDGDEDVIAFEIAIDKYMKEYAYQHEDAWRVDINGNSLEFLYDLLLGKNESEDIITLQNVNEGNKPVLQQAINNKSDIEVNFEEKILEFNDEYKFSTMGFAGIDDEKLASVAINNSDGSQVDLYTEHAYAILKADKEYVYFINPYDSKEVIKIEIDKLIKLNPIFGTRELPIFRKAYNTNNIF